MNMRKVEKTVYMTPEEFDLLLDYSAIYPTGTTIGKQWKRHDGVCDPKYRNKGETWRWMMGEYVNLPVGQDTNDRGEKEIGINWYEIVISTSNGRLEELAIKRQSDQKKPTQYLKGNILYENTIPYFDSQAETWRVLESIVGMVACKPFAKPIGALTRIADSKKATLFQVAAQKRHVAAGVIWARVPSKFAIYWKDRQLFEIAENISYVLKTGRGRMLAQNKADDWTLFRLKPNEIKKGETEFTIYVKAEEVINLVTVKHDHDNKQDGQLLEVSVQTSMIERKISQHRLEVYLREHGESGRDEILNALDYLKIRVVGVCAARTPAEKKTDDL